VAPAITGTKAFTGTPVNDAPQATNLSAAEAYTEDTPLNLTDIVITDVDSANVTATLTLSNTAAGSLSTATSNAVTSTFVAGVWTASGALADVNALLAGVTFTPALNFNSDFSIATSVDDGLAPAITGTKAFTGTPVNDAPEATNLSAVEAYTEDTPLDLTDIVITDVDSPNVTATLTLSNTAAGSLSTATSNAVTSTYNAVTGVWSASGAIADVNALLAGVAFTPASNLNGSFTVATSVSDGTAPAVIGSKAFTGTPVQDTFSAAFGTGGVAQLIANFLPGASSGADVFDFTGISDVSIVANANEAVFATVNVTGSAALTSGFTVLNVTNLVTTSTTSAIATALADGSTAAGNQKTSVGDKTDIAYIAIAALDVDTGTVGNQAGTIIARVTGGANTNIDAADITIIANLVGVTTSQLTTDNFIDFV
jgi:hypothetical protein